MHKSNQEKDTQETRKESQGRSVCEVQHDAMKEETEKNAFDGVVCQWQIHGRQRRMGIKKFIDIAMRCVWILQKQGRCKRRESSTSRGKGDRQCTKIGRSVEITVNLVMQAGELVFFAKNRTQNKTMSEKLQGHRVDVGDVEVVRIMCYSSSGQRTRKMEGVTRGRHGWRQLSAPAGDDDTIVAETVGVAGGQKTNDWALVAGLPLLEGSLSQQGKPFSHRGRAVTKTERDVVREVEVTS